MGNTFFVFPAIDSSNHFEKIYSFLLQMEPTRFNLKRFVICKNFAYNLLMKGLLQSDLSQAYILL